MFLTLNISVAWAWIFLSFFLEKLNSFSFINRSWNEDDILLVTLNALSCKEFILSLIPLSWNIEANRQYTYCDFANAFIIVFLFSRGKYGATFLRVEFVTCFFRWTLCDLQKRNLSQRLCQVNHSYFQIYWCYCRLTHVHCHCLLSIYPEPYLGSSQTSVIEQICTARFKFLLENFAILLKCNFSQIFTISNGVVSRTLSNIYDEAFYENGYRLKNVNYFRKKL